MSEPVLIWGAGAIGGSIGAALIEHGHSITFVDTDAAHLRTIRNAAYGLVVERSDRSFRRAADARLPDEVSGEWRTILLCVKAQDTAAAVHQLAPYLARDGYVVTLQNGLTEHVAAEALGAQRVIGGFVNFSADVIAPGTIRFGNRGAVRIGELDGAIRPRTSEVEALLRQFDPEAQATDDIWSYLWGKLGYASLLYAQATGTSGIVACLSRPELTPLWRALAGEIVTVAHAEGVSPRGFNGFDPEAFTGSASIAWTEQSVAAMAACYAESDKTHSGVWRDLAIHHRKTEADAHYDPVFAAAKRHGLACPTLRRLIAMIHAIEGGAIQDDRNPLSLIEPADA